MTVMARPRAISGLAGICHLDDGPVDGAQLERMSAALGHRGPAGTAWIRGGMGLACRLQDPADHAPGGRRPGAPDGGVAVALHGRLHGGAAPRAESEGSGDPAFGVEGPATVLAAYRRRGVDCAGDLLGDFALALFDRPGRRLLLARDALGTRPLFYLRVADTVLFASEIKAILAHPRVEARPDRERVAGYLVDGRSYAPGRTFFAGVSSLPPGHTLIASPERLELRRSWEFDPGREVRLASFADYAEAFRELLRRAVRRRLPDAEPVAVAVSGGLDSSSVFCLAETLRRAGAGRCGAVTGLSYQSRDGSLTDERSYLRALERRYSTTIERMDLAAVGYLREPGEQAWRTETPVLSPTWGPIERLFRRTRRLGCRVLLTGEGGDCVLFVPAYLVDLVHRGSWIAALRHLHEFGRWHTDASPWWFRRLFLRDLARHSVPRFLAPALRAARARRSRRRGAGWYSPELLASAGDAAGEGRTGQRRFRSAYSRSFDEMTRQLERFPVGYDMSGSWHGIDARFPLLDRELVQYLMAIPGEVQNRDGVPRAILRAGTAGILPDAIRNRRWKADPMRRIEAARPRELEAARELLCSGSLAAEMGWIDARAIGRDLGLLECRDTGCLPRELVRVAGVEAWLRAFFGSAEQRGGSQGAIEDC